MLFARQHLWRHPVIIKNGKGLVPVGWIDTLQGEPQIEKFLEY